MHGCGVTAGTLAGAIALSASGKKLLLTQTQYCMNYLELPLLPKDKGERMIEQKGIDILIRDFKSADVTGEQVLENSIKISDNLLLLPGGRNRCRELYDDRHNREIERRIMSVAHETCGHLIAELNPGFSDRTKEQIAAADVLVVCLKQNMGMISELEKWGVPSGKKETLFLFGMYDKKSRYSAGFFSGRYRFLKKKKTFTLPYLSDYLDALNGCRVREFLSEGLGCSWKGEEKDFFDAVKELAGGIGELL